MHQTIDRIKPLIRETVPPSLLQPMLLAYRAVRYPQDLVKVADFLRRELGATTLAQRLTIARHLYRVSFSVDCPHTQFEVLSFIEAILAPPASVTGCVVEAGCFKGGSTAKFSVAAAIAGRDLVVFDSFAGIPANDEAHDRNIYGGDASFPEGSYRGALDEVRGNVARHGRVEVCEFLPGWFEDTLPGFSRPVVAAYVDVDLASSTRTCIKYLYPLLVPGGVLCSQDGHLPLVIDVFRDDAFWEDEVGVRPPHVEGLGERTLLRVVKPLDG